MSSVRSRPSKRGSEQFEERKQLRAMPGTELADGRRSLLMRRAPLRMKVVGAGRWAWPLDGHVICVLGGLPSRACLKGTL